MTIEARPRVLIFAFACEPGRGSEPGAGWGVVRAVAEFAECVVLVGPEHRDGIARWRAEHAQGGDTGITTVVVQDIPYPPPARRGRLGWLVAYLAWLARAHRVGRRLHAERAFDVVHHATYSTYWLPTPAPRFGVPSVWGPVGGAVATPPSLWPVLGWRGVPGEVLDLLGVRWFARLPVTRRTWNAVTVRLLQNEATLTRLPLAMRTGARVLNHALFTDMPDVVRRPTTGYLVALGALESRKGPSLALRGLAHAPSTVRLVVVGDGPERRSLERLAVTLGIDDRVEFAGRVPRHVGLEMLAGAAAAVYTGLREEGGLALAEAMLCGTPVIVLANGGAATIARAATDPARVALIEPADVDTTARRIGAAMARFSRQPQNSTEPLLDRAAAVRQLREAFDEALASAGPAPTPVAAPD